MSAKWLRCLGVIVLSSLGVDRAAEAQNNATDAAKLISTLNLHSGSIVGEVGAGTGELSITLARQTAPTAHVYSSELGEERLLALRNALDAAGIQNAGVVEGGLDQTNFPDQCCDAIFMRNVYHLFADPPVMNASLLSSLKPGGFLAILGFAPRGSESTDPTGRSNYADNAIHRGVTAETVLKELTKAGFAQVSLENRKTGIDTLWMVVVRKPVVDPILQSPVARP